MQTRRQIAKLTLQQQQELSKLYEDVIISLSNRVSKKGTLNNRWVKSCSKEVEKAKKVLRADIAKQLSKSIDESAKLGLKGQQLVMDVLLSAGDMEVSDSFINMLSRVNQNVVADIMNGNLYKDNKTISNRIWNYGEEFEKDIQYTINQAILEKKSAIELAGDLEEYVKEPAKRAADWGKSYPRLRYKAVEYNAMRLARTSINHAYQNATIQSSQINPFIEGIKWHSAEIHGRTCQLCIDRANNDEYGLGRGVFPKDKVPLDHPNGLCTMIPHIIKSMDEIGQELRGWVDGKDNPLLDKWREELRRVG